MVQHPRAESGPGDRHQDGRDDSHDGQATHDPRPPRQRFLVLFFGVGFGVVMSPVQVIGLNSWLGR